MHQIEIATERLLLKGITPAIIHELFQTKNRQEIMQYFGVDEDMYEHYKSMHEKGMETFRISVFSFLLVNKEDNLPIGECGFHTWNSTHRRAELYYMLRDDAHKRKGLMTEALPVILNYGFTELGLHRIAALTAKWNTPSIRLLQKNGFSWEGTLREDYVVDDVSSDSDCYSLLKWEWRKITENKADPA